MRKSSELSYFLFYVDWDPRLGLDEGWAPYFVSAMARRGHDRADPEPRRLLPPEPPPPEAEPRLVGPQEAHEEQAVADAAAFLVEPPT
eukprot:2293877-Pyramimonas_sp.AAC.2